MKNIKFKIASTSEVQVKVTRHDFEYMKRLFESDKSINYMLMDINPIKSWRE